MSTLRACLRKCYGCSSCCSCCCRVTGHRGTKSRDLMTWKLNRGGDGDHHGGACRECTAVVPHPDGITGNHHQRLSTLVLYGTQTRTRIFTRADDPCGQSSPLSTCRISRHRGASQKQSVCDGVAPRCLPAAHFAARAPGLWQLGSCAENRSSQGPAPRIAAPLRLRGPPSQSRVHTDRPTAHLPFVSRL